MKVVKVSFSIVHLVGVAIVLVEHKCPTVIGDTINCFGQMIKWIIKGNSYTMTVLALLLFHDG